MLSPDVPVIDIAPWLGGGAAGRAAVARAVDAACRSSGFLVVAGHGVDRDLFAAMRRTTRAFFDLPLETKLRWDVGNSDVGRGYRRLGVASTAYTRGEAAPPDLRESFRAGPEPVAGDPYFDDPEAKVYFRANLWPDAPPGMGAVWTRYYAACDGLAGEMMRIFATALELAPDWFAPYIDRAVSQLVAVNYPEQATAPLPGQLRNGAHTDFGSLTLLLTEDRPGGLQIMGADGAWRDVAAVPDAFVVNIGDLMAQWSNERWRSTLHRVVNPPRDAVGETRRQSIVFFHQPNHDALIGCIPSCRAPGEAPRHAPIRAGDYLRAKIRQTLVPQQR